MAIIDESFRDYIRILGSILVRNDRNKSIISYNKVTGNKWVQGVYQRELDSVASFLTDIKIMCKKYNIK